MSNLSTQLSTTQTVLFVLSLHNKVVDHLGEPTPNCIAGCGDIWYHIASHFLCDILNYCHHVSCMCTLNFHHQIPLPRYHQDHQDQSILSRPHHHTAFLSQNLAEYRCKIRCSPVFPRISNQQRVGELYELSVKTSCHCP